MAISLSGDPADIAQLLRSMGDNNNGGGNANGSGGGGTSGGNTNGSAANTNSAGSGGSGTSGGNTSGTNSNSSGSGGNSGGANSGGNANSGGTNSSSSSGSGSGTGNTVATNGSGGGGGTNSGGGGGGTNSGGGGGQPKPTPTTSTPTTPAPTPATPTPTTGERVLSAVGLPKEELGKLKTEPLQGVKGLYKAQWMVAPNALGAAVAAPAVFKAGAEAAKQSGATDATIKAAKDAARLAASHGGKAMVAKGIGHAIPFIGSGIAALSAIDDFRNGRIVSGALNVLGIIPGPVGWTAMAAAAIWNAFGEDGIGKWDQPNGTDTWMLPASAKDISGVKELDAKIREAQNSVFRFEDGPKGTVWNSNPPAAIRIDGKGTSGSAIGVGLGVLDKVTGTASTDDIKSLASNFFNGLSDHFAAIDKAMAQADEPYFTQQRAALQPQLAAMAQLKTLVEPLVAQLTAASDGAATAYQAVLDTNQSARKQLSEEGKLTDSGAATTMQTQIAQGASAITAANSKIEQLVPATAPAVVAARSGAAPTGTRPAETKPQEVKPVAPVATPPAVTTSPQTPATPKQTPKTDDLSKLLSQLGQQAKSQVPTSNPLSSTGSGLGGGSPLGSQGLGGGQGGGTPLSTAKPDTSTKSEEPKKLTTERPERKVAEPKKLSDDKSLSTPKAQNAKAAVPEAKPAPAAAPVATPAPAAPTPAQQNAAHAAAQAQEPSKEVDVKGTKTTFPDAKTAAMAKTLAAADPTHPVSLADAAAKAGLTPPTPGQDPGKQVAPTDAKPGDILVAGGKNYMLLGEGKFYDLSDYKVVGASEIPQNMGERAGYFHLNDPAPGQPAGQAIPGPQAPPAAPQGPVSPQSTTGVQFPVPGGTGAPTGPVDASAPPAAPGGVPAAGTPGVPKPGAPGAGPANAASTATGIGVGGPSTGGQKLDPSAVR